MNTIASRLLLGLAGCLLLSLPSCGGAKYKSLAKEDDQGAEGIRYYAPAKYVLVYSDGKGGISWEFIVLPDQSKLMTVDVNNFLANGETTLTFADGMLTKTQDKQDSTAVPIALITAAETIAKSLAVLDKPVPGEFSVKPPRLYKVVYDPAIPGGWTLSGTYTDVNVRVTGPENK